MSDYEKLLALGVFLILWPLFFLMMKPKHDEFEEYLKDLQKESDENNKGRK